MPHSRRTHRASTGIRPIERSKISDAVAKQLEEMLRQSVCKVGEKLPPERVLVEQFGVGRTSIREALRSMEARGLVEIRHGLGVVVVRSEPLRQGDFLELGGYTVHDLLDIRLLLECKAASLAAERATAQEVEAVSEIVKRMAQPSVTDEEYAVFDSELHRTLVAAAKNPLLTRLYEEIRQPFLDYSRRMLRLPSRRSEADSGHVKIASALRLRSPKLTEQAVQDHLETVKEELAAYLVHERAGDDGSALGGSAGLNHETSQVDRGLETQTRATATRRI